MIINLLLQFCCVSVGLVNIAWLHGQVVLFRFSAKRLLYLTDEVHQFYRMRTTDVVDFHGETVSVWLRKFVYHLYRSVHDVVDVGEVAYQVSIIEHINLFVTADSIGKQHGAISGRPHGPYTVKKRKPVDGRL